MAEITALQRRGTQGLVPEKGPAYSIKTLVSAVEVPASASGTTIAFGNIPSNARITGQSTLYWDDLTTTGSPTLDLGLAAVDGNLVNADDPDALTNGADVTSAGSASALSDINFTGTPAWDLVASETSDPGGELKVYGSIKDAATAGLTGTVVLELYYYVD